MSLCCGLITACRRHGHNNHGRSGAPLQQSRSSPPAPTCSSQTSERVVKVCIRSNPQFRRSRSSDSEESSPSPSHGSPSLSHSYNSLEFVSDRTPNSERSQSSETHRAAKIYTSSEEKGYNSVNDKEVTSYNSNQPPSLKRPKRTHIIVDQTLDLISALPDSVLLHILSFLPTKYAVTTGTLSKRWQHLWTSVPNLVFRRSGSWNEGIRQFVSFVNRTLLLYGCSNVRKFYIDFEYQKCFESRVNCWVRFATRHNVEELDLHFDGEDYALPQFIYSYSLLKRLNLRLCEVVPNGVIDWRLLKNLSISDARLSNDLIEKILSGSPKKVSGEDVSSLVEITLNFRLLTVFEDENHYEEYRYMLRAILENLHHVKQLTIGTWCIQFELDADIFGFNDIDGRQYWTSHAMNFRDSFVNLRTLKIFGFVAHYSLTDLVVPLLQCFLKNASALERMIIYPQYTRGRRWPGRRAIAEALRRRTRWAVVERSVKQWLEDLTGLGFDLDDVVDGLATEVLWRKLMASVVLQGSGRNDVRDSTSFANGRTSGEGIGRQCKINVL
ncbi:hypothetical protein F0562_014038 [Nyssa sinensis]|uniref:F-box domain-containing protein n=1 Tax=Nyssa sinensis TaxID=561372 RepID=A0A5J4ZR05_9ASTE|nr:hypothetical protein F0562_014038 [Nyssa sinensis]